MPTTRKQPFTGRGAGAKQPSGTYRKPKGPEAHGPGLRELERLAGQAIIDKQAWAKEVAAAAEEERRVEEIVGYLKEGAAKFDRQTAAADAADKALRNPRPLPKRKRGAYAPAFGYRVVRRYDKHGCQWLEVCDVLYDKGKPMSFGLTPARLTAQQTNSIMDLDDAQALAMLRQKHELILAAFAQPILDEKTDFGRISIRP